MNNAEFENFVLQYADKKVKDENDADYEFVLHRQFKRKNYSKGKHGWVVSSYYSLTVQQRKEKLDTNLPE